MVLDSFTQARLSGGASAGDLSALGSYEELRCPVNYNFLRASDLDLGVKIGPAAALLKG